VRDRSSPDARLVGRRCWRRCGAVDATGRPAACEHSSLTRVGPDGPKYMGRAFRPTRSGTRQVRALPPQPGHQVQGIALVAEQDWSHRRPVIQARPMRWPSGSARCGGALCRGISVLSCGFCPV